MVLAWSIVCSVLVTKFIIDALTAVNKGKTQINKAVTYQQNARRAEVENVILSAKRYQTHLNSNIYQDSEFGDFNISNLSGKLTEVRTLFSIHPMIASADAADDGSMVKVDSCVLQVEFNSTQKFTITPFLLMYSADGTFTVTESTTGDPIVALAEAIDKDYVVDFGPMGMAQSYYDSGTKRWKLKLNMNITEHVDAFASKYGAMKFDVQTTPQMLFGAVCRTDDTGTNVNFDGYAFYHTHQVPIKPNF